MKLVILGTNGMMGSMLYYVAKKKNLDVHAIDRSQFDVMKDSISKLDDIVQICKDSVTIVNCIGCIPQKKYTSDEYKKINQEFPHSLSKYCQEKGIYFIHLSTNCVYSGKAGDVSETDVPDADDTYGMTKLLGEPVYGLVIRSSIIGPERNSSSGLFAWYTQNKEKRVNGFLHQYWNGLTTLELSYFILEHLKASSLASRIVHVRSEVTVSKYELLCLIKNIFFTMVAIDPIDCPVKQYTLTSTLVEARKSIKDQLYDLKDIYNDFMKFPIFSSIVSKSYISALPFPHMMQDSFLEASFAANLQKEILTLPKENFDRYQNPFESKYTLRDKYKFPPLLTRLFTELQSDSFVNELSKLCEHPLQLDTERHYWGVHLYDSGDCLDIHVDAGIHPILNKKKHLTLGIYLSANYDESHGCHLELWNGSSCLSTTPVITEKAVSITPIFNRLVLFTNTDTAWHGNPTPLNAPPSTKRIFITISYLSDDTSLINTNKKAYFIKRPEDPDDVEKDRLRLLRVNPETCKEVYRVNM